MVGLREVALAATQYLASLSAELGYWFQFAIRAAATIAESVTFLRKDFGVESLPMLEHEVDRTGDLVGQDRIGHRLRMPGLQFLGVGLDLRVVSFADHGGLTEGPAQIGVAQFAAAASLDLAGAGTDRPAFR